MSTPIEYWTIGTHFLQLAELACGELVKSGNQYFVITENLNEDDFLSELHEQTKWSDINVGVPIIFNFFHGTEVLLKGFIVLNGIVPPHHLLTQLLADFEQHHQNTRLGRIIEKFTRSLDQASPLGQFFVTNNISPDRWYEALKYPESSNGQPFTHLDLKFGYTRTVNFWQSLGEAARDLQIEAVKLARALGHV